MLGPHITSATDATEGLGCGSSHSGSIYFNVECTGIGMAKVAEEKFSACLEDHHLKKPSFQGITSSETKCAPQNRLQNLPPF